MDGRSRFKDSGPPIVVRNSRDDIVGVARLLLMAKASATLHCPDKVCISLMEKCIVRLLKRHGLSRAKLGGDMRTKEFIEVSALLRILRYAQVEAIHSLSDAGCADLLGECINRLTRTHQLSQSYLHPPTVAIN
jgi:hypothetical protein